MIVKAVNEHQPLLIERDAYKSVIKQIIEVCRDNAIAASDHRFDLKFVESVALGVIKNGSKP